MKKPILVLLSTLIVSSIALSACEGRDEQQEAHTEKKPVTLTVRNPKVEIANEFEQMAKQYEEAHPGVRIKVETVGGASDDYSDITAKLTAGKGPDIFTNIGNEAMKEWIRYLEDLSDEPWVDDASPHTLDGITLDGKVYGAPMSIEGFGVVYNRDLFKEAGITEPPKTFSELEAAARRLSSKGITPFANGYYEDWKLGHHLTSVAFAEEGPVFVKALNEKGTHFADSEEFNRLFSLIDLTVRYGNTAPATTDYYTEVDLFKEGKVAMILQGNWVEPLLGDAPTGIFPLPLNDRGDAKMIAGVPSYWVINKQSSGLKKKEAKRFLRWMVSSEKGQEYMTERFRFIPAFKNVPVSDLGSLGKETYSLISENRTFNWSSFSPCIKKEFGEIMKAYINKESTRQQALKGFDEAWNEGACAAPSP